MWHPRPRAETPSTEREPNASGLRMAHILGFMEQWRITAPLDGLLSYNGYYGKCYAFVFSQLTHNYWKEVGLKSTSGSLYDSLFA